MADGFHQKYPNVTIKNEFSGTGGGFKKFCAGQSNINAASRPINAAPRHCVSMREIPNLARIHRTCSDAYAVPTTKNKDSAASRTIILRNASDIVHDLRSVVAPILFRQAPCLVGNAIRRQGTASRRHPLHGKSTTILTSLLRQ